MELWDEKGRAVSEAVYPLLCAAVAHCFAPGAPVMGAWQDSDALEEMAASLGVRCLRCGPSRRERMELTRDHPLYRTLFFDGIGALTLLLEALKKWDLPLWQLVDRLPKRYRLEKRLPCRNSRKGRVLQRVAQALAPRSPVLEHGVRLSLGERGAAFLYPRRTARASTCAASRRTRSLPGNCSTRWKPCWPEAWPRRKQGRINNIGAACFKPRLCYNNAQRDFFGQLQGPSPVRASAVVCGKPSAGWFPAGARGRRPGGAFV